MHRPLWTVNGRCSGVPRDAGQLTVVLRNNGHRSSMTRTHCRREMWSSGLTEEDSILVYSNFPVTIPRRQQTVQDMDRLLSDMLNLVMSIRSFSFRFKHDRPSRLCLIPFTNKLSRPFPNCPDFASDRRQNHLEKRRSSLWLPKESAVAREGISKRRSLSPNPFAMADKTRSRSWSQLCRFCGTETAAERRTSDIPLWFVLPQKKSILNHRIFSETFSGAASVPTGRPGSAQVRPLLLTC
jgi:hypothetical protein